MPEVPAGSGRGAGLRGDSRLNGAMAGSGASG